MAFLFELVNAGLVPSYYSNEGAPIPERTQLRVCSKSQGFRPKSPGNQGFSWLLEQTLTPGPMKSLRFTVSLQNGLVIHNPGFNG